MRVRLARAARPAVAAVNHQPRSKTTMGLRVWLAVSRIATRMATPRTEPICRAIVTTAEPVEKLVGGSEPTAVASREPTRLSSAGPTSRPKAGTTSGPGATAKPVARGDQCQTCSAHTTIDSRLAANGTANSRLHSDAGVKPGTRSSGTGRTGDGWRA